MRTLMTLGRGIIQGTIALIAFSIFIVLELYVVDITIDLLVNNYGMNPGLSKFIWIICYIIIAFEIIIFFLKVVIRNIKHFFQRLF